MLLIATDILADLCGLSLGMILTMFPIGLMLWLLGWWSHRFWIVLGSTVLAGVFGLMEAPAWRVQPIVVAVLLAIAAGVLALALIRVVTFVAGGLGGVYLVQLALPTVNQPLITFLICGLIGLLLFRWFFMASTSLAGGALLIYASLALFTYYERIDAVTWTNENSLLATSICGGLALCGFGMQFLLDRWRTRRRKEREEKGEEDLTTIILARIGFGTSGKKDRKKAA
ncbi:MAG: hypothetical protein EXS16_13545 [Gemmataceae bacterium]|nr:hypothetical protein [Gemmataceae bacterium]